MISSLRVLLALVWVAFAAGSQAAAAGAAGAVPLRPVLHWGQNNATLFVTAAVPRGAPLAECEGSASTAISVEEILEDRIVLSAGCAGTGTGSLGRWSLELREDVRPAGSRWEPAPGSAGSQLLVLQKQIPHRWDRLLMDEREAVVGKDWRREEPDLPEEDEVELPRSQSVRRLSYDTLLETAKNRTLVVAMRYPWCTLCEEKDKAFVKATKLVGGKAEFADVAWASLDLREEKRAARDFARAAGMEKCERDYCPLFVFKPDEPVHDPYRIEMQLLYEMDEMAMMSDPMIGSPGYKPKNQNVKPNFERLERDLGRLLPPAVEALDGEAALEALRARAGNVLVASGGVDVDAFRRAGRGLRGIASLAQISGAGEPLIQLWAAEASPARTPLTFPGGGDAWTAEDLGHFTKVHVQPLMENYTWSLKDKFQDIGLPVAMLWANFSDVNSSNTTERAVSAFRALCDKRRGTNSSKHVLCTVMDESYAYYQREYGTHEPYPYPYFGITRRLGFGEGDRYGFPFKEPVNKTVHSFFRSTRRATKEMDAWLEKVLRGKVPTSHESGNLPEQPKWVRGTVQEIVWKTYQTEINGSTADVLLEVYDDQRKKAFTAEATMNIVAATLKDYANLKIARMEASQNYLPAIFGRKQFSKDTEYYWVPPSIASGEWTPEDPVRYIGEMPATPASLLRFLKKHSLSHWSLKEALETADDLAAEVMSQANADQRVVDQADEEKQRMIKKMMSTLKKEKGMVDVGEMMGLKKAAEAVGATTDKAGEKGEKKTKKKRPAKTPPTQEDVAVQEKLREERRLKLKKDEDRLRELDRKDKEKRKKRKQEEKRKKEERKRLEAEARAKEAAERERKRKKLEEERARVPTNASFTWGQSKEAVRLSVSIPALKADTLHVNLTDDWVRVSAFDLRGRLYSLDLELREFVVQANATHALRYSDTNPFDPQPDGVNINLQKAVVHRWDRLAQNHVQVKALMKKDWVQDDGELEEEKEDVDLPSGPNVKKVTAEGLQKLTAHNPMVVTAIRFPWCDKCGEKDREFTKVARTIKDKEHLNKVAFAVVDAREDKHLARRHNYSCSDRCELFIFKQDEPDDPYEVPGRRYAEEIQIDCYKHLLPVVNIIEDKATFDRVASAFDTAIVGFFEGPRADDEWYPQFRAVARRLRGHALFGAIFGGQRPQDYGIEHQPAASAAGDGRPTILLFKPKESRHVEFTEDLALDKLTHFSKVLSLPLLSTYDFEMRQKYQELKVPLGMMWLNGEDEEAPENEQAKAVLRRLALRFSGYLVFVMLNNTRDALLMRPMALDPRRVPAFGISASEEPEAEKFGFDLQTRNRAEHSAFWADGERAYERLESFCAAFLDKTLEVSHESAELPPKYQWPGAGAVEEVVWRSFRQAVYRTEHDVLLELYSPFRPQHRSYITVLDLVAEALKDVVNLKIARMDTANNYVLPEFGLSDKEKSSTFFFLAAAPERQRRPRRFGGRGGKAEALPEKLVRFLHRETRGYAAWDVEERVRWVNREAQRRIKRLRALEKDYEKKMQDEWMQKEMEEFERYKRLGKFDNLPPMG